MNARKEGQIPFSSPSPPFPLPSKGQLRFQRSSPSRLQWRVLSALACPLYRLPVSRPQYTGTGDKDALIQPALPLAFFFFLFFFLQLHKNKHQCLSVSVRLVFLSIPPLSVKTISIPPLDSTSKWLENSFLRTERQREGGGMISPDSPVFLSEFDNFCAATLTLPCPPHVSLELLKC